MARKILILIIITLVYYSSSAQVEERKFIQSLLYDMKELNDLHKYVYKSKNYIVDSYFTEKYIIKEIKDDVIVVDINPGKGNHWVRLYFRLIRIDKKLYLEGKIINSKFISPWYDKELLYPPVPAKL